MHSWTAVWGSRKALRIILCFHFFSCFSVRLILSTIWHRHHEKFWNLKTTNRRKSDRETMSLYQGIEQSVNYKCETVDHQSAVNGSFLENSWPTWQVQKEEQKERFSVRMFPAILSGFLSCQRLEDAESINWSWCPRNTLHYSSFAYLAACEVDSWHAVVAIFEDFDFAKLQELVWLQVKRQVKR